LLYESTSFFMALTNLASRIASLDKYNQT